MNLQDQVIYRCIHAACARPMPRKVNFCPYCGTGQHDGVINHAHVARPAQAEYREAQQATPAPAVPPLVPVAAAEPVQMAKAPPQAAAAPVPPSPAVPPAAPAARRPGVAAPPPQREPVRLRYWLIVLAALWLIWLYAKPSTRKIENKIDSAIVATEECRLNDAQSAVMELRIAKATDKQIALVQSAIKAAEAGCSKKQQREKAWSDTLTAVDSLLEEGAFGRAQARLLQFTKRYNDDGETRKLRDKINVRRSNAAAAAEPTAAREPAPPLPAPREASDPQKAQSVRNLIGEAERAVRAGDYRTASDKLETCITMVDPDNSQCASYKIFADRLQGEKQRCLAAQRQWSGERCR